MDFLKWKIGYSNGVAVAAVGRSGGLACLWNDNISVSLLSFSKEHIDVEGLGKATLENCKQSFENQEDLRRAAGDYFKQVFKTEAVHNEDIIMVTEEKVVDLVKEPGRQWNDELLYRCFDSEQANLIMAIPLIDGDINDQWIWDRESKGVYSVRTGYEVACETLFNATRQEVSNVSSGSDQIKPNTPSKIQPRRLLLKPKGSHVPSPDNLSSTKAMAGLDMTAEQTAAKTDAFIPIYRSVSLAAAAAINSPSNPHHNSTRFTRPLSLKQFTIVAVISHLLFHAASPLQPSVTTSTGVDTSLIG
ncbi:hypothetical protein ACFE04_005376 [Oxalis oulophora]